MKTCEHCGTESGEVVRHRQNTQYVNQEMNFVTLCPECKAENDEYWEERWAEYHSSCM